MGSAQVASVSDGTSGYWNPAGLVGVKENTQINLMHAEYFAGIGKYDFASIAFPAANNKRTFAVTGLRFAVDDIMNQMALSTTIIFRPSHPQTTPSCSPSRSD